jgi:acetyl-CoA synthetase
MIFGKNRPKNLSLGIVNGIKFQMSIFLKGKIAWFEGATLNVSYNCLDRHLPERADQVAIIWEGDDPDSSESITYQELYEMVCKFANGMKDLGVEKG